MKSTDRELVARCREGDREAFRTLVERHQRSVFGIAVGMVRTPEDAMDITQEVFIRAFSRLPEFKGDSSFATWVCRIAVNLCIDRQRRYRSQAARFVFGTDDEGVTQKDAEQILQENELGDALRAGLDTLSEDHRAILILREVDGLSYEAIAETLECPVGTVMSRLHHARKKMQLALRPYLASARPSLARKAGEGVRRPL